MPNQQHIARAVMRSGALSLLVCLAVALLSRPTTAEQIQLRKQGGTYSVPVRINDALTLEFVLDTGAADVSIPTDVVMTLLRTGTVATGDFVGNATYSVQRFKLSGNTLLNDLDKGTFIQMFVELPEAATLTGNRFIGTATLVGGF